MVRVLFEQIGFKMTKKNSDSKEEDRKLMRLYRRDKERHLEKLLIKARMQELSEDEKEETRILTDIFCVRLGGEEIE